jgi:mono/diheme cytochrome c family protein
MRFIHVVLLTAVSIALSGCAVGKQDLGKSDEPIDRDKGRQQFQQTCRVCHSLADADAAGTFGPDLDKLQPDANRVREQISSGGGGMPKDLLDGADADLVARYVAEVAGQDPTADDRTGIRGRKTVK